MDLLVQDSLPSYPAPGAYFINFAEEKVSLTENHEGVVDFVTPSFFLQGEGGQR